MELPVDDRRAAYYAVLDLEAWARRVYGDEFMEWATANHLPLDIVFGLAQNFGTVLLNGDGFGGPPWSTRVSLANLPTVTSLRTRCTPHEMSNPTPPGEITPPASTSVAATPPIGNP